MPTPKVLSPSWRKRRTASVACRPQPSRTISTGSDPAAQRLSGLPSLFATAYQMHPDGTGRLFLQHLELAVSNADFQHSWADRHTL